MKKFQLDLTVADNRMVGPSATLLTLQYPGELPDMVAGQFAELQVPSAKVMLRRPISIHSIDRKNNLIEMDIDILEYDGERYHEKDWGRQYIIDMVEEAEILKEEII